MSFKIHKCEECDNAILDYKTTKVKCKIKGTEIDLKDEYEYCDDFKLSEEKIREEAICGVCEYYMMDEYCGYKKLYILDVQREVCEAFEPCEEYLKRMM